MCCQTIDNHNSFSRNSFQKLMTIGHQKVNDKMWYIQTIEYLLTERNELPIHATTLI